jgi:hypothetical protein
VSSISVHNFSSIDDDHKELSFSKESNFKTKVETLDTWISLNTYPNGLKVLSHMKYFFIYKIPKLQIKKRSNKEDMTKKPNLTQNLQNLITLTNKSFSFEILRIEVFYSLLQSFQISLQDLFTVDLDLDLKI